MQNILIVDRFGEDRNAQVFEFFDLIFVGSDEEQFGHILVFHFRSVASIKETEQLTENVGFNVFYDDGATGRLGHVVLEHGGEDGTDASS